MKQLIGSSIAIAALAAVSSLACSQTVDEKTSSTDDKIIGGVEATPNEFDGATVLYRSATSAVCGGTLVAPNWVLSAAHCVISPSAANGGILKIVVGRHKLSGTGGEAINVKKAYRHSGYNSSTLLNDISLFELETPSTMPVAKLVNPDLAAASVVPAAMTTVAGWGSTREGGGMNDVLMKVDVPIIDNATCKAYPRYNNVADSMICAGYATGGKDSCQGDSGGPLFMKIDGVTFHVGLTSWGIGCARPNAPGVYTRTTSHLEWIKTTSGGAVLPYTPPVEPPTEPTEPPTEPPTTTPN
jgi:trypsin